MVTRIVGVHAFKCRAVTDPDVVFCLQTPNHRLHYIHGTVPFILWLHELEVYVHAQKDSIKCSG